MKVSKLIEILQQMPANASVDILYDGAARTRVERVYITKGNRIIVSDAGEPIYNAEDRPHGRFFQHGWREIPAELLGSPWALVRGPLGRRFRERK